MPGKTGFAQLFEHRLFGGSENVATGTFDKIIEGVGGSNNGFTTRHEDKFANVPEITMVWPVPQSYQKDAYALDFLAKILADGNKAPLYKVLVKEKKLTSRTSAYNNSGEYR